MKEISIGIIGCGAIGLKHIQNFSSMDGIKEIMICDASEKRLNFIKRKFKISKAFTSVEDIVQNSDALCISTPNSLHFTHALEAINAGKDVLVEKPMTTISSDAEKLVEEAEKRKVILAVGCQKRFNKDYQHLKATIHQGRIGKPIFVRARMLIEGPYRGWKAIGDWWYSKEFGSGALIDTGSHMIDLILWIFPFSVTRVSGFLGKNMDLPVEEYAFCILGLENNLTAILELGWFTKNGEKLEVVGTMGGIEAKNKLGFRDYLVSKLKLNKDEWYFQDRAFVMSVLRRKIVPPLSTGMDGLKVVRIVERIYEQSQLPQ